MNMGMKVHRELYVRPQSRVQAQSRSRFYVDGHSLKMVEYNTISGQSDWSEDLKKRYSDDHGKTWGPWQPAVKEIYELKEDDEIGTYSGLETYHPAHGHFVSVGMQRIFLNGHEDAYHRYWRYGEASFIDHSELVIRKEGEDHKKRMLIKYEPGSDYDPNDHRNPSYLYNNRAYFGLNVDIAKNDEIIVPIEADITSCCRLLGLNVSDVFPSCPQMMSGLIVARGGYDPISDRYELRYSKPVVISDLKSSRGVNEAIVTVLPSGRILAVFRGSNSQMPNWNTRIEKGVPAHKWYTYSDDDGESFTDPMPWHFDDQEVFYSAATYSLFIRSSKNDGIYWIGNMTDHHTYGNGPRYPLMMARVNERGLLEKETLTEIDTKRENEAESLQLSNFHALCNRVTGNIEIFVTKLGQNKDHFYHAECFRYIVEP